MPPLETSLHARLLKEKRASPVAQQMKNALAMQEPQEMWVQFLGHEDPLEKEMATVFLPGKIPGTEEPGGLQSLGSQRVRHN